MTSQTVNGQVETYRYDAAGNLLQDAKNTYEYDAFRRTSKVTTKASDVQINRYDAEGLRYEMEENGKLVQFIFNENKEVIAEQEDGNITRLIRTNDLWAMESEPEKTWYHYASDEQGSTIFITDRQGKVKNRYAYDAFGNIIESEEQISNRYQYTGQQFEPITQQYYLRARFYNPVIGRFTQEDEYHGDGLNLYAYCANNPVDYYDPSGYYKNPVEETIGGISKRDFDAYLEDIEKWTGRKIGTEQREKIYDFLRTHDVSKPIDRAEYNKIRDDFNKSSTKERLRKEYSEHNNLDGWPTYQQDYLDKFGKVSDDRIGHNYDLHHIIPKRYGGPNEWWNMIPAANPEEYQSGIHRGVHKKLFPRVKKRMV